MFIFNLKFKIKNPKFRSLDGRGYTAVEMIIALAMLGTVIFTVLSIYRLVQRSYNQVDEKSRLQRAVLYTSEQMVQNIRQARSITRLGQAGQTLTGTNVHLDSAGVTAISFSLPNLDDPLTSSYDATLTYFLKPVTISGVVTVKLYQYMKYYNNTWSEAFPAMASTDQYRAGKPTAVPEPNAGTPVVAFGASTPTPVFNNKIGRMPGVYESPNLSFDDVSFFYDSTNSILAVGLTCSMKSSSLSKMSGAGGVSQRRRLTLTSSVAIRKD